MADCTPEQSKLVDEILSIKRTDYYRVLKVNKSANDVEIKKSYRKLAIKLHPDKNKHPKASEAFKVIAKAFEILGDESKRKMYDMTGSDPDSRGGMGGGPAAGAAGMNGFPGFQGFQGFPQGAGMGGGLNEDILNMLFGMGGMGGNGFSFQFGGNGFPNNGFYYSNTAGMNARRRAQQQHQQRHGGARRGNNGNGTGSPDLSWSQYIIQFLPLIIILFSILINSFSGGSSDTGYKRTVRQFRGSVPKYSFEPFAELNVERTTPTYNLNYYISEKTVNDFEGRKNADKEFKGLDKYVEEKYVEKVSYGCINERNIKKNMIESAQGIFFSDWGKIDEANKMPMPNCEKLHALNLL
jgi:DnaJ family protein B protein 12